MHPTVPYFTDLFMDDFMGKKNFILKMEILNQIINNILEEASEITGLNYVEANPDLDTYHQRRFIFRSLLWAPTHGDISEMFVDDNWIISDVTF